MTQLLGDPELNKASLGDPELNAGGIFDPELVATTSAAPSDTGEWAGCYPVARRMGDVNISY